MFFARAFLRRGWGGILYYSTMMIGTMRGHYCILHYSEPFSMRVSDSIWVHSSLSAFFLSGTCEVLGLQGSWGFVGA